MLKQIEEEDLLIEQTRKSLREFNSTTRPSNNIINKENQVIINSNIFEAFENGMVSLPTDNCSEQSE